MKQTATCDFVASLSGRPIQLKKGEEFEGSKADEERLARLGLIEAPKRAAAKRKDDDR